MSSERGARRFRGSKRATDSFVSFGWDAPPQIPSRVPSRAVQVMASGAQFVPLVTAAVIPLSWFTATPLPPNTIGNRTPQHYRFGEVRGPPLAAFPRADVWGRSNPPNPTANRAAPQFVDSGKVTFTPISATVPNVDKWHRDSVIPILRPLRRPEFTAAPGYVPALVSPPPEVDATDTEQVVDFIIRRDLRRPEFTPAPAFVSTFPDFAPKPDTWHRDAVIPVLRDKRRPEFTVQPAFVSTFPDFVPKVDAWHVDPQVPVRRMVTRQDARNDFVSTFPAAATVVLVDRWNADPVVPVRRIVRNPEFTAQPAYTPTIVAVIAKPDTWHVDPQIPVRRPRSNAQQERYGAVTLTPAAVYFPLPDSWYQDFVVPVRRVFRQPQVQPAYVPRFVAVIATPDMFHRAPEIPVRRSLRRPELISGFGFAPYPIATPAQTIFNIVDVTVRFAQTRTESVEFQQQLAEEVRFALIRYVDGEF